LNGLDDCELSKPTQSARFGARYGYVNSRATSFADNIRLENTSSTSPASKPGYASSSTVVSMQKAQITIGNARPSSNRAVSKY
jgi:hypothetical protein